MKKTQFTEELKQLIIYLYDVEKLSSTQISKIVGIGATVLINYLNQWGYRDSKRRRVVNKKVFEGEDKTEIIDLYQNKEWSLVNIAKKFKTKPGVIKRNLKAWGIDSDRVKYTINNNFFNKIDTEAKAYWLGFISADGYVGIYDGKHRLGIEIKDIDRKHLEKFLRDIDSNCKIYTRNRGNMVFITIYSKELVNGLIALGVVPNKAKIIKPCLDIPNHLIKHYWRGLIDGDGHIKIAMDRHKSRPTIYLYGSVYMCTGFANFCRQYSLSKANISKNRDSHVYGIAGSGAIPIIRELYEGAEVYLDRKYATAMQILTQYG